MCAAWNGAARDSRFHLTLIDASQEQRVWRNFLALSSTLLDVVIGVSRPWRYKAL